MKSDFELFVRALKDTLEWWRKRKARLLEVENHE